MTKKYYQFIIYDDDHELIFSDSYGLTDIELLKTQHFLFLKRHKKKGNLVLKKFSFNDLDIPTNLQKEFLISLEILFPFSDLYCSYGPFKFDTTKPLTFFGGSFNPLHNGHRECIRQCLEFEKNLIVVPDYSPWKDHHFEAPLDEIKHLELELKSHFDHITIYPIFWGSEKRNPTSVWLSNVHWQAGIHWLMGEDTFDSLLKWFEVDKFFAVIQKIYVCPRLNEAGGHYENHQTTAYINSKFPEIEIVWLGHHEYESLSSSKIRSS